MKLGNSMAAWTRNLVMLAMLLALAQPAGAATINFDTFPDGSAVPNGREIMNQYLSLGVSFSSTSGGPIAGVGNNEASSAPNFLMGNYKGILDSYQPITLRFTSPVAYVKATLISVGDATVTATAYDADNESLTSVSITNPNPANVVGLNNKNPITLSSEGISSVTFAITTYVEGDGFGIDDVEFPTGAPVPAPASLALLGGGMVRLLVWGRRRLRAA